MDSRFRSPVVPRKVVGAEEAATSLAKKSKRSKSTENSLEKGDPFMRMAAKGKTDPEDPMSVLNKRWSVVAKNQETMSKQELLNNYRLLMNDHLRLERFLSIITKDNEMARNRLETDLLDAMMCIEDLKQALEVRMARRRKIDPREAEERRSLIRQNKKLLNQLYESAKKIEVLELTKLEMKEQLELLDFQMVEIENQKAMVEEELRRQPVTENGSTQTDDDLDNGPAALAAARVETASVLTELANQQAECAALSAKHRHLENLVRELRRDNTDLREQIGRVSDEAEDEDSLAESDKHTRAQLLQTELATKAEQIILLEEHLAKSEAANKALKDQLKSIQTTSNDRSKRDDESGEDRPRSLQLSPATVQQLVTELEGVESLNAENLLESIRNLKRLRNSLLSTGSRANIKYDPVLDATSPEYYSAQFSQLQNSSEVEGMRGQLAVCEKRRADLERRVAELSSGLSQAQAANRANEAALTASRRNEAALRRRLLATIDTGSTNSQRSRPISSLDYSGTLQSGLKDDLDAQTKMIKLEAVNLALSEASQLDRVRLQEQATRIAQLEAEQRTLHDRMASLQASESCAQRASVRLQALYEDMLREFSESTTHEANLAAARRRQRQTDLRGYETDTAVHTNSSNRYSNSDGESMKPCTIKACVEVREVLRGLQERFIRTAEQLAEAETLLAEVGGTNVPTHPSAVACGHLLAALRACTEGSGGSDSGSATGTQQRLFARLETWVVTQLARRDSVEAQLRQRCGDLEVELAKASPDIDFRVLKSNLEAQKKELADLCRKLESTQDELEAMKALCENHRADCGHFEAVNGLKS
uniref:Expressed conserved protein n=1 Tax=Echinococcus granulosus TaxID=6210 RepID=A0A068WBZ8_ECHGR|nr:expressed conserved protein [Echinococcus granulosus]